MSEMKAALDRLDEVINHLDNMSLKDPETIRIARLISDGFDALSEVLKVIGDRVESITARLR